MVLLVFFIFEFKKLSEWRVPDSPENVRWKTNDKSITLWWDPPASAGEILVRGYTISYGIGTPSRRVIIEGVNTNAFTISGLKPNTTYVFAMTAYNEAENEDSEKVLFTATTEHVKNLHESRFYLEAPIHVQAKTISPNEVEVHWVDPNVASYQEHFSDLTTLFNKRKYVIQYGKYQSLTFEKVTSAVPHVLLNGLESETEYEIAVKIVIPSGIESAWSLREVVRTSKNESPSKWLDQMEIRCDFEKTDEKCIFQSDLQAPLQWTRIQASPNMKHGPHRHSSGQHFIRLQSTVMDDNYGRLISAPLNFDGGTEYCLGLWIYVKPFSKGTFSVGLLRKVENRDIGRSLFVGSLNRIAKGRWRHLLLNLPVLNAPFQVSFEVRKQKSDRFWIALDDITLVSRQCIYDSTALVQNNGRLIEDNSNDQKGRNENKFISSKSVKLAPRAAQLKCVA
ncbi:unnamed protein product [Thelazia callipaeda]|uniref:Fibronectin type-III domain-containing protein n=1 Tax=Thelazia callipaeda TaxID=103827 RepID=A0A0N5CZC5_THECL|nr:unnamed protein product [Thelazia callipaeda]